MCRNKEIIFNTGETNFTLKEIYNPEESLLRKCQLRMLDMLIYIDDVCKKINVKYSLDGGNILGAVRHGGFIPWDDDVDIILERDDYEKLCKYLKSNPHPQYVLQTPDNDPFYINYWNILRDTKSEYLQESSVHKLLRYRGLQIDIFPIENNVIPILHKLFFRIHYINRNRLLLRNRIISRMLYKIGEIIVLPIVRLCSKLSCRRGVYSYSYGLPWYREWKNNILFPYKPIFFESHYFPAPSDINAYLKTQYGEDYLNLPKETERNHHQTAYKIWE